MAKKETRIKKHELVGRLVEVPQVGKRQFWSAEMVLLNRLIDKYGIEFIESLDRPSRVGYKSKLPSLAVLWHPEVAARLQRKCDRLKAAKMKAEKREQIELFDEKFGEDIETPKSKSLSSWLQKSKNQKQKHRSKS